MLDGRRIWLVGGRISYARVPSDQWADRIHAAKLAGLNTIEVPVFWNRHEPRPGKFDFTGDADLKHFIQLCGKAGMWVILRVGPFVGLGWDQGGLPAWLAESPAVKLRTANGPFLEACSRFISALSEQVRALQITAPGDGGPIILIQFESQWTCGHDTLAMNYLGELARYLREAGMTLPTINDNNLWQNSEGQVDCWVGSDRMLATMRQLATVRQDQPRVVIDLDASSGQEVWGQEPSDAPDPWVLQRTLAEVLAGGGQYNLSPFAGGTNFGFWGGRLAESEHAFVTTAAERHAPIGETGARNPSYNAVRRISTFASRFARVFASLEPSYQPVVADPSAPTPAGKSKAKDASKDPTTGPCTVTPVTGTHGGVAFVFAGGTGDRRTDLLMPDGTAIAVHLGEQQVSWVLMDTNITSRARLDYSTLNALGMAGKAFVCFGPGGTRGVISINGSPLEVEVPADDSKKPFVHEHEGVYVVAVNERQIDSTFLSDETVYVGVESVTADGRPAVTPGAKQFWRIAGATGEMKAVNVGAQSAAVVPETKDGSLTLGAWKCAGVDDYLSGESARYAKIAGAADLAVLGCPFGYGWYRLDIPGAGARKAKVVCPAGGDRLHLFVGGEELSIIGAGPGATSTASIPLRKGSTRVVVLAENLGRFAGGMNVGEHKGLVGHLWEYETIKVAKPKVVSAEPLGILGFKAPLWEVRDGDCTSAHRVHWTIPHRKKSSLLLTINGFTGRALIVVNGAPAAYVDRSGPDRIVIDGEKLAKGNNSLEFALITDAAGSFAQEEEAQRMAVTLSDAVEFHELLEPVTEKAEWSFAKWEAPSPASFEPAGARKKPRGPAWWQTHFKAPASRSALFVDLTGMTKGQLYINGRHLGRYFAATADGKALPPQQRYHVPRSFLKLGEENELLLFDEHGGNTAKVRVVLDGAAAPFQASV
jgi:hypothetical protein